MAYEMQGAQPLDYAPCRYGASKLLFRGPKRSTEGRYAAFLGGIETYGKFIERPFPALVEMQTGMACVNLGWPNAGLDMLVGDDEIVRAASGAAVAVLQVPGAQSLSNRYYSVHPRRNDRFVQPSPLLRAMFGEVDFTEFHFVRHLLRHLSHVSSEQFALLRDELQAAWVARMTLLLRRIDAPVLLLWMSAHTPPEHAGDPEICADPALVTRAMLEAVRGHAAQIVDATLSHAARSAGIAGMVHSEFEANIAAELPGPAAHKEVAQHLVPVMRRFTLN
ncbi:DUF6473 family protein [Roseovarius sp. M141]|uniref:DUF6473 family protein n=1 Tax=Roseovarius sp. M141 TaxID=2583806 RepID=UPI0020CF29FC|nr:DUF6473 family protein [Roseovarius sp. M141]MCQ0092407.1 hypothetical protein [Roseovarius sp. M141]